MNFTVAELKVIRGGTGHEPWRETQIPAGDFFRPRMAGFCTFSASLPCDARQEMQQVYASKGRVKVGLQYPPPTTKFLPRRKG